MSHPTVMYNGVEMPGFASGSSDEARLRGALDEILGIMKRFEAQLTPREKLILQVGLTASHFEESAASGDWKRAEAHADNLSKLVSGFI